MQIDARRLVSAPVLLDISAPVRTRFVIADGKRFWTLCKHACEFADECILDISSTGIRTTQQQSGVILVNMLIPVTAFHTLQCPQPTTIVLRKLTITQFEKLAAPQTTCVFEERAATDDTLTFRFITPSADPQTPSTREYQISRGMQSQATLDLPDLAAMPYTASVAIPGATLYSLFSSTKIVDAKSAMFVCHADRLQVKTDTHMLGGGNAFSASEPATISLPPTSEVWTSNRYSVLFLQLTSVYYRTLPTLTLHFGQHLPLYFACDVYLTRPESIAVTLQIFIAPLEDE